jgi:hypothetical protein
MSSFESTELYNLVNARKIYDNWGAMPFINSKKHPLHEQKNILKKYILKNIGNNLKGKTPTSYHYCAGKKNNSRQYVTGVGLQNLMKEVRESIACDHYNDIDMVNSEPSLLLNFCIKSEYPYKGIKYYCDNRDACLTKMANQYKMTMSEAKNEIIAIINGGKLKYNMDWFVDCYNEIVEIHRRIAKHPSYEAKFDAIKTKKDYNTIGTLMAEIFNEIENKCLLQAINFLKQRKISIENIVLVFDGLMIPKKVASIDDKFLSDLSNFIYETTHYDVKYILKPMKNVIDLKKFEIDDSKELIQKPMIADDDKEASNLLLSTMKGQCFCCEGIVWLRSQSDRVFLCEETSVIDELINRCMELNITDHKGHPYGNNMSGAKSITMTALNQIKINPDYRDNEFVDRMTTFTRGKVFFQNGYMDFEKKDIIIEQDYDDYEIITPVRISRNLPILEENRISGHITKIGHELIDKVLLPIFGDAKMYVNYLHHIARAITGHIEDKDWLILSGMRNCGKGVLTSLNNHTFGIYSGETSANNFLMERAHTIEDPKKYAWLKQHRWTRLLHTSEIKIDGNDDNGKIDGNLIKNKISSGGDKIEVRDLYQKTIRMVPQCRLFMMCNDVPQIAPPDAVQTLSKFNFPSKFVEQDIFDNMKKDGIDNPNIKKADPLIKDFVMDNDVCEAFLLMVFQTYEPCKVINCQKVIDDTNDIKADLGDETALLKKYFVFTGKKDDVILSTDLSKFHKEGKINISINKLKQLLTFNGATNSQHLGETKKSRGFVGVILLANPKDD